ncbi:hypothetical protein BR93DRAFT_328737 [Coniochaeta sp. PMI_546]|nr:hypothetical protein BR93DRAFT_328737 [Coniochaeta sp. PMI_546]
MTQESQHRAEQGKSIKPLPPCVKHSLGRWQWFGVLFSRRHEVGKWTSLFQFRQGWLDGETPYLACVAGDKCSGVEVAVLPSRTLAQCTRNQTASNWTGGVRYTVERQTRSDKGGRCDGLVPRLVWSADYPRLRFIIVMLANRYRPMLIMHAIDLIDICFHFVGETLTLRFNFDHEDCTHDIGVV